jgi:altronate dehydratase
MSQVYQFEEVGRLPLPADNVAIAAQRLEAGTQIAYRGRRFRLDHEVLEGHRFAVEPIAPGEDLLSWGLPFGRATRALEPGHYACNQGVLEALAGRSIDFALPASPNFVDRIVPYQLDEASFVPGKQVELYKEKGAFMGYARPGGRGVGTRNWAVVLGTSSRTSSFARLLEARLKEAASGLRNVDGVVAVAHTEGGGHKQPNNQELLLRTLAGFMVHPNVGAVLAIDYGTEAVTNQMLREYMQRHGYPLEHTLHSFMSLQGSFAQQLEEGERQVRQWLGTLSAMERRAQPLEHLKIALQCGGSDAFSGVSGNPLAAWAAREVIRHGGSANLAETDELIGAESYVLNNVRDLETARRFLEIVERFKERVAWHGESAEANPSGGNKYRGLYNIVLKSIGAAMKRHPEVRLDYCIEYGQPMVRPGYYFMDSPGNDLESIAGQVASGCNLIFFITGNGSITNFPFVPTLKILTTTRRFELLSQDMDVNAGAYQDGVPMEELGRQLFDLTLEVAAGRRSKGERAGHAQVQIWRDWPQRDASRLEELRHRPLPSRRPLEVEKEPAPPLRFQAFEAGAGLVSDQVGLILPTSLCAGQIARLIAERLSIRGLGRAQGLSRFVALVHTEGCGVSGGSNEELYGRALLGYLAHPLVRCALLLEHGCEKTHNDYMRLRLAEGGLEPERFGWASVQLDGGIEKVMDKVEGWFKKRLEALPIAKDTEVGLEALWLGLLSAGPLEEQAAACMARLTRWVVGAGGTVVVPESDSLLRSAAYVQGALAGRPAKVSLAHGQRLSQAGLYVMEAPTDHWTETLTGLGATGVQLLLAHAGEHPLQGHPLVPLVQISSQAAMRALYGEDLDLELAGPAEEWAGQVLALIGRVAGREQTPRAMAQQNTDFQITRGLLGVSM